MISREEAIVILSARSRILKNSKKTGKQRAAEALDMAIEALWKRMPVKPKEYEDKYYVCPICGNLLMHKWAAYPEKLIPRSDGLPYCLS